VAEVNGEEGTLALIEGEGSNNEKLKDEPVTGSVGAMPDAPDPLSSNKFIGKSSVAIVSREVPWLSRGVADGREAKVEAIDNGKLGIVSNAREELSGNKMFVRVHDF